MPILPPDGYLARNITIPLATLGLASGDVLNIGGLLDRVQLRVVATLLSTACVGIYTVCAVYAAKILIHRGPKGNGRKLFVVSAAMYTATFIYWVLLIVSQFQALHAAIGLQSFVTSQLGGIGESLISPSNCFPASSVEDRPEYCTSLQYPDPSPTEGTAITQVDCAGTVALTFNVFIGDAIVWWRVWVLWNKSRGILVACSIILLATLACSVADSAYSCNNRFFYWNSYIGGTDFNFTELGTFFGGNVFGLSAIVLSLFSNTLATSLVGYKAWRHRLRTKRYFSRVPGVTQVQRVLMLLVESGIAYCILWALILSSNALVAPESSLDPGWSIYMLYFTEGCLVAFVGIYPTLIIILVALDKSEIEKQSLACSIPVVHTCQPSSPQVHIAMNVISDTDTRVDHGTSSSVHSVILNGPPVPPKRSSMQLSEVTSEDGQCAKTES